MSLAVVSSQAYLYDVFVMRKTLEQRFWEKVNLRGEDDCWEWMGARFKTGYGSIYEGRANHYAHRMSWSLANGPIPPNLVIMHSCDNKRCVNPNHLSAATQAINLNDAAHKGRMYKRPMPGESNPAAVLTETKVALIRAEYEASGGKHGIKTVLAHKYGVTRTMIYCIVTGKNWRQQ